MESSCAKEVFILGGAMLVIDRMLEETSLPPRVHCQCCRHHLCGQLLVAAVDLEQAFETCTALLS
eukprot:6541258-Pyramimonas_sp.AAC.1